MSGCTSPQLGGLPHLQLSHDENAPQLSGLPGLADRVTRLGGVLHLTCESDKEKKRDCLERLVTPPRWGTSPSRGPPPPCEQALRCWLLFTCCVLNTCWLFVIQQHCYICHNSTYNRKRGRCCHAQVVHQAVAECLLSNNSVNSTYGRKRSRCWLSSTCCVLNRY